MSRINTLLAGFRRWLANQLNLVYPPQDIRPYCPNSTGSRKTLAALTTGAANQSLPLLAELSKKLGRTQQILTTDECCQIIGKASNTEVDQLAMLLDHYGSDKASGHAYHPVYAAILGSMAQPIGLLEIGLGTNNISIASNMGRSGRPGASLRAFRDYLPQSNIYGADIDKNILFQEERIKTWPVDQTDQHSLQQLAQQLSTSAIQLIIDDGLHAPHANLNSLIFALELLDKKKTGWLIIEDIPERTLPLWHTVAALLEPDRIYQSYLVKCKEDYLFIVRKQATETA